MTDLFWVSLAVTAGVFALAGVPLRCWQFYTGRLRSRVPRHPLAQATFMLCGALILLPNLLGWAYALYVIFHDYARPGEESGIASAVAVGMLGCAYILLEGFLLTALRRTDARQPGNALLNSAAKRE
jgi:hypothetical protein